MLTIDIIELLYLWQTSIFVIVADYYTDNSGMPVSSVQGYLSRPVTPLYTDEEDHPQNTVSHNRTQDHTQTSPDCHMSDHTSPRMFAENFEGTRNVRQNT